MKDTIVRAVVLGTMMALSSTAAPAHEMFLKADKFIMSPDTDNVLQLFNGTFDESSNPIARDRMQDVSIVHHGKTSHPTADKWFDSNNISFLNLTTGAEGTYVAGVSTRPRIISLSAEDFAGYLKHDGVLDTLAIFEKNNSLVTVRERYSKHVRAIFQVGERRTEDFKQRLNYPVEILVQNNPYSLKTGDSMAFQVLYEGQPAANQLVYASHEGFHGHDRMGGHIHAYKLRTDADGMARFNLKKAGKWYISLIHMKKVDESDVDYQSDWATVTFEIK